MIYALEYLKKGVTMLNCENIPKDSLMYEIIKTMEPSDEFRSAIENIFKRGAEKSAYL